MSVFYPILLAFHFGTLALQKNRFLEADETREVEEDAQTWIFPVAGMIWMLGLFVPFWTLGSESAMSIEMTVGGLVLFFLGFFVRILAYRSLGRMFTYDLGLRHCHQLVTTGVHARMRHPSYTGTILIHLGLGLVANSLFSLVLTVGSISTLMFLRVQREEALLEEEFGDAWRAYASRTNRWLPLPSFHLRK